CEADLGVGRDAAVAKERRRNEHRRGPQEDEEEGVGECGREIEFHGQRPYPAMLAKMPAEKSRRVDIIHGPKMSMATNTPTSLGTKVRVASFTWVTAWMMLTTTPMTSVVARIGAPTRRAIQSDSRMRPRMTASFM